MKTSIVLYGSVAAGSTQTIRSKRIGYPFRLRKMTILFPVGSDFDLAVYPIVSNDKTVPTGAVPQGQNILEMLGNVTSLSGTAEKVAMEMDIKFTERSMWLKAYLVNGDGVYSHNIKLTYEIEAIEIGEK